MILHYWGHGGIRCGAPVDGPDTRTTSAAQSVTCPTCLEMLGVQVAPAISPEKCPECGEGDCNGAPRFKGLTPEERMRKRQLEPYFRMREAELVYLRETGWEEDSPESWSNEELQREGLYQGHAVNVQKQYDRITLQHGERNEARKRRVREPAPRGGLAGQEGGGYQGVPPIQDTEGCGEAGASDGQEGVIGAGHSEHEGSDPGEGQSRA